MSKDIFIMLTGPSACGKSEIAKKLAKEFKLGIIHNDGVMGRIFGMLGMEQWINTINMIDKWWPIVDAKANCAQLIQKFHRDDCKILSDKSLILAEGYLYSFRKYRCEVYKVLQDFSFVLIYYYPRMGEQIRRYLKRNNGHSSLIKKSADEQESHARYNLTLQHNNFQLPDKNEPTKYFKCDDSGLKQLLNDLSEK